MTRRARDNPFAVHRVLAIGYEPVGWTWDDLLARLEQTHWRGAIVGPHGSGKTTLLDALAERLRERGFEPVLLRLNREKRTLSAEETTALRNAGPSQIVLLDGSEQLTALRWQRLQSHARRAGGLVITAHDRARLPVLVRCQPGPEVLRWIVQRLTGTSLAPADADALLARHHGNLRHALRALYDDWAGTPER